MALSVFVFWPSYGPKLRKKGMTRISNSMFKCLNFMNTCSNASCFLLDFVWWWFFNCNKVVKTNWFPECTLFPNSHVIKTIRIYFQWSPDPPCDASSKRKEGQVFVSISPETEISHHQIKESSKALISWWAKKQEIVWLKTSFLEKHIFVIKQIFSFRLKEKKNPVKLQPKSQNAQNYQKVHPKKPHKSDRACFLFVKVIQVTEYTHPCVMG